MYDKESRKLIAMAFDLSPKEHERLMAGPVRSFLHGCMVQFLRILN
jgi:hypothetical protein